MTRFEWRRTSPDEKLIFVAECVGWKKDPSYPKGTDGNHPWTNPSSDYWVYDVWELPDYLNDLNAIVQAEIDCHMFTSWDTTEVWIKNLKLAVIGRDTYSEPDWSFVLQATAAQRCEALIVTLEDISIPKENK